MALTYDVGLNRSVSGGFQLVNGANKVEMDPKYLFEGIEIEWDLSHASFRVYDTTNDAELPITGIRLEFGADNPFDKGFPHTFQSVPTSAKITRVVNPLSIEKAEYDYTLWALTANGLIEIPRAANAAAKPQIVFALYGSTGETP